MKKKTFTFKNNSEDELGIGYIKKMCISVKNYGGKYVCSNLGKCIALGSIPLKSSLSCLGKDLQFAQPKLNLYHKPFNHLFLFTQPLKVFFFFLFLIKLSLSCWA